MEAGHPIDLKLPEKLKDRDYRKRFFLSEASARIAEQLIALRKKRGLNQKQLADLLETRQPAISRVEQADYQNWSFSTLKAIAGALDARIRVSIEPAEDILGEYENAVVSKALPFAAPKKANFLPQNLIPEAQKIGASSFRVFAGDDQPLSPPQPLSAVGNQVLRIAPNFSAGLGQTQGQLFAL